MTDRRGRGWRAGAALALVAAGLGAGIRGAARQGSVAAIDTSLREHARSAAARIDYELDIEAARPDTVAVVLHVSGAGRSFRLAMAVHPEYDDRYWRHISDLRVDGGAIARTDSTLWQVTLSGDEGTIRYLVYTGASDAGAFPGSWRPFVAPTGALVNGPDLLLYLPEQSSAPVSLEVHAPAGWRIATGLRSAGPGQRFLAAGAAELLDSPLLLGDLATWRFRERGADYRVAYWPLPGATPFDAAGFVADLRRLVRASADVFGGNPFRSYVFLLRDGAGGALEHRNSVTVGLSSAQLARERRSLVGELAHEFFHSWNLVAVHPAGWGDLDYRPPARTPGLWFGEGVTMYYADVLPRRAGLSPPGQSRLDHVAALLGRYYDDRANLSYSPEQASLAFGDTPIENPAAAANYYVQGELIGLSLDALLRDSTSEARGLDDLLRELYRHRDSRGFTEKSLRAAADRVCGCQLDGFFALYVSGSQPPPVGAALARLGLTMVIDTVPATNAAGEAVPEVTVWSTQRTGTGPLRLVVADPGSAWAAAGLRTGDTLLSVNASATRTAADFRSALRTIRAGDSVPVEVLRDGRTLSVAVRVRAARRTRVRFLAVQGAPRAAQLRLMAWSRGL